MKILRLKKKTLAELSDHFPVLDVDAQSTLFGGGDGSLLNPYTESEYNILANSPYFTGGYVNFGNGVSFGLPASVCTASFDTGTITQGTIITSQDSGFDWQAVTSYSSIGLASLKEHFQSMNWAVRFTNSKGEFDFMAYGTLRGNGFTNSQKAWNEAGRVFSASQVGRILGRLGNLLGATTAIVDGFECYKSYTNNGLCDETYQIAVDVVADVISIIPAYGTVFSIVWSMGLQDAVHSLLSSEGI